MMLLGIDTCGASGTLALARLNQGTFQSLREAELAGRTTAAMLIPALDAMLREADVLLSSLTGIVVVDGPGSFTGIRIGLSAAKGLAEALAVPVFAVSRLRVLAAAGQAASALLDAGRGEFYYVDPAGEEWLLTGEEVQARLAGGAPPTACETKVITAVAGTRPVAAPTAADAVRAALPEILAGRSVDVATLDGRYLRRTDLYQTTNASPAKGVPGS